MVSIFGAMFAPTLVDVAREMVRVLVADVGNYYGPTMNAVAAAEQNGKTAELQQSLEVLSVAAGSWLRAISPGASLASAADIATVSICRDAPDHAARRTGLAAHLQRVRNRSL